MFPAPLGTKSSSVLIKIIATKKYIWKILNSNPKPKIKCLEKELIKLLESDLGDFDSDFFRVKFVSSKNVWNQIAQNPAVPQSVEYQVQYAELDREKATVFFTVFSLLKLPSKLASKTKHNTT